MARNLIELFERFSESQSIKDREVLEVRVVRKLGVGRARVKLPGCDQEVTAQEPTPIACGSAAQAVVNRTTGVTTILPGARSEAGQIVRITKKPRSSEPPVDPNIKTAQFLILFRDGGGLMSYVAYEADGTSIEGVGDKIGGDGVGTSFFPEVADDLGPGVRVFRDDNTGDLVVIDFLGPNPPESSGSTSTYTPPDDWIVTNAQKVGASIYWWEREITESSVTTPIRLMRSLTADLSSPSAVFTGVATSSVFVGTPDWEDARGPDFTTTTAGLWLSLKDGASFNWERAEVGLDGSGFNQRGVARDDDQVPSVLRAGHAATSTRSITQTSTDPAPTETTAYPAVTWNGNAESDYAAWASVGDVIDIAPDADPEFKWVLLETPFRIERYNAAGALQESIELSEAFNPIGLHYLKPGEEFLIDVTPEPEE